MVTLAFLFWIFVGLFAVIGAMRGWAQELLVAFSIILAIFIILGLLPFVQDILKQGFIDSEGAPIVIDETTFWVRTLIVLAFAIFGYQTPRIQSARIQKATSKGDRLQDLVLGILIGGINGYLIFGTVWFFIIEADYFLTFVSAPPGSDEAAARLVEMLPPILLSGNNVFFAIALAFAFVVVIFI
jgi:hypothetical protein